MVFLIFSVNLVQNSQKQTYLKEYLVLACTSVFITQLMLCLADLERISRSCMYFCIYYTTRALSSRSYSHTL